MTAREHIRRAARKMNLIGVGQDVPGEFESELFDELNAMMRQLRARRVFSAAWARNEYPMVANQATRTIGPSGQFAQTVRPMAIDRAAYIAVGSSPEAETEIDVYTREEWARIVTKSTTATVPRGIHYEKGDGPLGLIYFHPIPTTAATLILEERTAVSEFADFVTDLVFTEGSEDAIQLGLVIRYAPMIPRAVSQEIKDLHYAAEMTWMTTNLVAEDADVTRPNPWAHTSGLRRRRRDIRQGV